MKVKCILCGKSIESSQAVWYGYDGDYRCEDMCKSRLDREMADVNSMTDRQFEHYICGIDRRIL